MISISGQVGFDPAQSASAVSPGLRISPYRVDSAVLAREMCSSLPVGAALRPAGDLLIREIAIMNELSQQATEAPRLKVEGASKRFPGGQTAVYEDIAFNVEPGSFVSLIGPSGCGKSTVLKSVAGLLKPDHGEICWEHAATGECIRPEIGYIFQDATLLPWFSVRKNVEVPLRLRGIASALRAPVCREMLKKVWLEGFEDYYPKELSGGMKMRVSLARALTLNPQVMLLDEPFGALDAITRNEMNRLLIDLWFRQRWTALFVTHSVNEAVMLSDRVLVMSARPGRIVEDVAIDLPHPRSESMVSDSRYQGYVSHIRSLILASSGEASVPSQPGR